MSAKAIEVRNAVKDFKENRALNHVTLSFERGMIHGIIGRNGSGKTVLMRCICGFMALTSGHIKVNGDFIKPWKSQDMGIIIEVPGFITNMSGYKNLLYLSGIRGKADKKQIADAMTLVGLDPDSPKKVGKYSLGMRQRLGIAQAVMEEQEILILDEPMNGLDNQGVKEIRQVFSSLRDQGKTILLASHSREDIRYLCDTVVELDHGNIIAQGGSEIL